MLSKATGYFGHSGIFVLVWWLHLLVLLLQFVLKHKEFRHLREVDMFPNTVNPHKEESLSLVSQMIDQVLALHEELRWFHIGFDEV